MTNYLVDALSVCLFSGTKMETITTARKAITKALSLAVIHSPKRSMTVNSVPEIMPAIMPAREIFFHHRLKTSAGPKAAPKPPQA